MSYLNFFSKPSEAHRNEASDPDDDTFIVISNETHPEAQRGMIDEASASDNVTFMARSNETSSFHIPSTQATDWPPSDLDAQVPHEHAVASLETFYEGARAHSPHSPGLTAGRNLGQHKQIHRSNLEDIITVASEEICNANSNKVAGITDPIIEPLNEAAQAVQLQKEHFEIVRESKKQCSTPHNHLAPVILPTVIQHEQRDSIDDLSEMSDGCLDDEVAGLEINRLLKELSDSPLSLQRSLVVETSPNVNVPKSLSTPSTSPPGIPRQESLHSYHPEFSFDTFASVGRSRLQNQIPEETLSSEDGHDIKPCHNVFALIFSGIKNATVLIAGYCAAAYNLFGTIVCLLLSLTRTTWEGTKRFYLCATHFFRSILTGYSNLVVAFMAGVLTTIAFMMVLWLVLYGALSVVNFTSVNVTAIIDTFLQQGRLIPQALGGELPSVAPPVSVHSVQEDQVWSDAFLGLKPEPIVMDTWSDPISVGTLHPSIEDPKHSSNKSMACSQADPSDSLDFLTNFGGNIAATVILLLLSVLYLVIQSRLHVENTEDTEEKESQRQVKPVAADDSFQIMPPKVSTEVEESQRQAKPDDPCQIIPPTVSDVKSEVCQESFESMTWETLRDECHKRKLTPPSIKEDLVRILCVHEDIAHSFPELDLSAYGTLKKEELKRHLYLQGSHTSGNKNQLMYRLARAREDVFMDMTCREMRDILCQYGMVQNGRKRQLARRLAEAGPFIPLVA